MLTRPITPRTGLTEAGALAASVRLPWATFEDETSFVTALGLRALRARPVDGVTETTRNRMLDFLETCSMQDPQGAFAFWPADRRPDWAEDVPPDADDTALCLTELYLGGRLTRAEAVRRAARLLLTHRSRLDHAGPSWIPEGAFLTWLRPRSTGVNIVDCAANANILACLATLGMVDAPGWRPAIRLIDDGLAWAGDNPTRLAALAPFYPELAEFRLAVENAVASGCHALAGAAAHLRHLTGTAPPAPDAPICSAAYGRDGWRAPALAALRSPQLRHLPGEKYP